MESKQERPLLFSEFPPVKTEEWERKILEDLKGADYDEKLIWRTTDGMELRPYYRREDLSGLQYLDPSPGQYPFVHGNRISNNEWEIRQDIVVRSFAEGNKQAHDLLERGVTSPGFILNGNVLQTAQQMQELLSGIDLQRTSIHFTIDSNDYSILQLLSGLVQKENLNPALVRGSLNLDPFGHLFRSGRFYEDQEKDMLVLKKAIGSAVSHLPSFKVLTVNACIFHNAGASLIQELAFSLAAGAEYLSVLTDSGLTVDEIVPRMMFHFPSGTGYFPEIAKLRAARLLWSVITHTFGSQKTGTSGMYIHSSTSEWKTTIYDIYNNILRGTTGTMSAVMGGANSILVTPFDQATGNPGVFSERLARNTQIILKEEAYLNKVADPGAGSYYIENLTDTIAASAWQLFRETEKNNGILHSFKNGGIQGSVEKYAKKRLSGFAQRKEVILGINQYPDLNERASWKLSPVKDTVHSKHKQELFAKPLKKIRAAAEFENLRLRTEKAERRPVVFLLTFGDPLMRRARAGFSAGFFTSGGFSVLVNPGYTNIEDGIREALNLSADIVVMCSSDDEYAPAVAVVTEKLKDKAILVIAGHPDKSAGQLKKAGIEHFIHMESDVVKELKKFQKLLKIF
jgi:methylmalonyl-CoA mutase